MSDKRGSRPSYLDDVGIEEDARRRAECPPTEIAFSMECPGCQQALDIPEGCHQIPPHPRDRGKAVPAYEIGARFPAVAIGTVTVTRPCKWSGAMIVRRIPGPKR